MNNTYSKMLIEILIAMFIGAIFMIVRIFRIEINTSHTLFVGIPVMLPVFIIAFRWGTIPAVISGTGIGVIVYFIASNPLNMTPFFDLVLPLSAVGSAGLFKQFGRLKYRNLLGGIFVASMFRLLLDTIIIFLLKEPLLGSISEKASYMFEANTLLVFSEFVASIFIMSIVYYFGRDKILYFKG